VSKVIYLAVLLAALVLPPTLAGPADVKAGRTALKLAKRNKFARALKALHKVQNPLPAKIIRWLKLTAPGRRSDFADVTAFIADNPEWPGQVALRQRAEASLPTDMADEAVLAWFETRPPITVSGAIRYAKALAAAGKNDAAAELLRATWIDQKRRTVFPWPLPQIFAPRRRPGAVGPLAVGPQIIGKQTPGSAPRRWLSGLGPGAASAGPQARWRRQRRPARAEGDGRRSGLNL